MRGLCLCLLAATLLPTAAARSCVSAYAESGGAHITRDSDSSTTHLAVCSGPHTEVCSGWLVEETCEDIMASFTTQPMEPPPAAEEERCVAAIGHTASGRVYLACHGASRLPGRLWYLLILVSGVGWAVRAGTLFVQLRAQPLEQRFSDGTWPLVWTCAWAYAILSGSWQPLRMPGLAQLMLGLGALPLALSTTGRGKRAISRLCAGQLSSSATGKSREKVFGGANLLDHMNAPPWKKLLHVTWLRSWVASMLGSALLLGLIWDRTCNSDPGSIDSCALWRLGSLDQSYSRALHIRLSTGEKATMSPESLRDMVENKMCLPPHVKGQFAKLRPSEGGKYSVGRFKPWCFGTDASQTRALEESALHWGIPLKVEGHGLKWEGLQMKIVAFKEYIKRETVSGDIVMMMDANDVLFVDGPQVILDAYQALAAPVVVSAERGCAPAGSGLELGLLCSEDGRQSLQLYPMHTQDAAHSGFRYVNSGTYLGDRDAVLHMLEFFEQQWDFKCLNALGQAFQQTRDQRCITAYFVHCNGQGDIALDWSQSIVSTLAGVGLDEISLGVTGRGGAGPAGEPTGRIFNHAVADARNGAGPTAMLHGNGWQAHLTKNEFSAKYTVVVPPAYMPAADTPAWSGEAQQVFTPRMAVSKDYAPRRLCWEPSNARPCHGFDLVGALYGALWMGTSMGISMTGRLVLLPCSKPLCVLLPALLGFVCLCHWL